MSTPTLLGGGTYGLGVDLGTTYTAAAVCARGRAEIGPARARARTPSRRCSSCATTTCCWSARPPSGAGATDPDRVAREFKRSFGDGIPFLLGDGERHRRGADGPAAAVGGRRGDHARGRAARARRADPPGQLGRTSTDLLVTAAEEAGLADVGLLVEPVAAAAFYASTERLEPGAVLAVYDLGGGTFDATVVRKTAPGSTIAGTPEGDDALGGVDFDQAVLDHVVAALGGRPGGAWTSTTRRARRRRARPRAGAWRPRRRCRRTPTRPSR